MKLKNVQYILCMTIAMGLQACGSQTGSSGFTEEDISTPQFTPGIQEGLCEETEAEFTFKSNDGIGNGVTFSAGTGLWVGPDGTQYAQEQTKSASTITMNEPYPCTMEIFENGDVEFVSLLKAAGERRRSFTRGTALVN